MLATVRYGLCVGGWPSSNQMYGVPCSDVVVCPGAPLQVSHQFSSEQWDEQWVRRRRILDPSSQAPCAGNGWALFSLMVGLLQARDRGDILLLYFFPLKTEASSPLTRRFVPNQARRRACVRQAWEKDTD